MQKEVFFCMSSFVVKKSPKLKYDHGLRRRVNCPLLEGLMDNISHLLLDQRDVRTCSYHVQLEILK